MSELKSYDLVDIQDYRGEVYRKSEADKVINELEADKLELRQRVNVLEGRLFGLSQSHNVETYTCGILERKIIRLERKIEISDKQLRHSNRNRCLAIAAYFELREDEFGGEFAKRWLKIWLELAKEPTWAKFLLLIHPEEKP